MKTKKYRNAAIVKKVENNRPSKKANTKTVVMSSSSSSWDGKISRKSDSVKVEVSSLKSLMGKYNGTTKMAS